MPEKELPGIHFAALRDFTAWIKMEDIHGIIIGGIAASLLGRPRVTRDVDSVVIIAPDILEKFVHSGRQYGFIPRITNVFDFAQKSRVLLMKHETTGIDIDISLGILPFEYECIERVRWIDAGGLLLPLPTPEDLIIMKAVAHRQRDLIDIEAIRDAHPNLDLERIRRWVREFSSALEMPEILNDLEKILSERKGSMI